MKSGIIILTMSCWTVACHTNTSPLDARESKLVTDSVQRMTSRLINDLSVHGPIAWLNYFDESPGFYMISDGQLAFNDYQSGKTFIEDTLTRYFVKINLQLNQLHIDPLTSSLASIRACYHEELADSAGKIIRSDGYLTALVKQTNQGWKFRSLRWSMGKSK